MDVHQVGLNLLGTFLISDLRFLIRHKKIYQRAKLLDKFIDFYIKAKKRVNFPHKVVKNIVCLLFPNARYEGKGAFKTVHHISTRSRELILKFSMEKNIKKDFEAYTSLPPSIRNRYFAKIYWSTKYCLLQKYGKKAKVPDDKLQQLKIVAKKYGLSDVRVANIRKVNGNFKIVDASVSE
jgi:hypothetical protein